MPAIAPTPTSRRWRDAGSTLRSRRDGPSTPAREKAAAGAWIGTRFLASQEATIHPRYRERLLSATEDEVIARSPSVGEIVRYQSYTPGTDFEGDIDALSLWAGQSVGLVSEIEPAADIVREIVAQAQSTLEKLMSPRP
jgi:NAD(P)H-dependent flavin oxidoreductase YrpB (nitropropane dioxygenase family)